MKTIDEDIKRGTFRQVYLLYGEEAYLKKQYKEKLKNAFIKDGDTMNFALYQGKNTNPKELIDLAETLPFFAERRVIFVEDSGFFKTSQDELAEYLKKVPESACFVFVEEEVDKRSKMYKAVKKSGAVIEFAPQSREVITRWILGRLKREDKKITQHVMQLFLSRTGLDMGNIDVELEKLLSYTMKKNIIEAEDVEAVVTEQMQNRIFEMVDAIAGRNQRKALDLYYDLLALKEPPMRILYLITRQFRILIQIKELLGRQEPPAQIAKKVKVPEFTVPKYGSQAKSFTKEQLLGALEDGARAEEAVKTGKMNEKIAVEIFIVQYSKKERPV